ncbi:hypothetical protein [Inquilinus sp. CAU 1745]|uniref:hypothetical protein n=1 Tax=Inquilinus sp. CAU 1745 TaxID=3140369 RepID=UPI00325A7D7F
MAGASKMEKRDSSHGKVKPALEWFAAGVGLALTLALVGFLFWEAFQKPGQVPPDVTAELEMVTEVEGGFVAEIVARNRAPTTAAAVMVSAELKDGEETIATGEITFDYIPGRSLNRGGLFFDRDPRQYELELRVMGYTEP